MHFPQELNLYFKKKDFLVKDENGKLHHLLLVTPENDAHKFTFKVQTYIPKSNVIFRYTAIFGLSLSFTPPLMHVTDY